MEIHYIIFEHFFCTQIETKFKLQEFLEDLDSDEGNENNLTVELLQSKKKIQDLMIENNRLRNENNEFRKMNSLPSG